MSTTSLYPAHVIQAVYQSLKRKRSNESSAEKIGLELSEYMDLKGRILNALDLVTEEVEDRLEQHVLDNLLGSVTTTTPLVFTLPNSTTHLTTLVETTEARITDIEANIELDTLLVKGLVAYEPRSADEIVSLLKIDTSKWTLKQYWNKEKNGRWEISALVAGKTQFQKEEKLLEEAVRRIFSEIDIEPMIIPVYTKTNQRCLMVYLSDKHIGASVSKRAMYGNNYSDDEYKRRMNLVLDKIMILTAQMGVFHKIIIADQGDKMDGMNGFTTRGGHKLPQQGDNRSQYEACLEVEKNFFDQLFLSGAAQHYEVIQNTNSNHGGDFEYMVSRHLEMYLNLKYPQVKTHIQQQLIEHIVYGVHTILLTHGKDDEDMKHGLPMHMNEKTENLINKYLMFHGISVQERVVTLAKGDLHVNNSHQTYGFRYRNCSSLFGSSKWIQTNFGPGRPGCSFDIYDFESEDVLEGLIQFDRL